MCNATCDLVLWNSSECGVTKEQTKSGNEVDIVDKAVDIVDKAVDVVDKAVNIVDKNVDSVNIKNKELCGHCR